MGEKTLEESLLVLDGSAVYPSSDSDRSDDNNVISSSGASSYSSMDKVFETTNETPSKCELTPSFEENKTLTPKTPGRNAGAGDGSTSLTAMSPIALQQFQLEQEQEICSLTQRVTNYQAKETINQRDLKHTRQQLKEERELHEELIEKLNQQEFQHAKKCEFLSEQQEILESERAKLAIQNQELTNQITEMENMQKNHDKDYEAQINILHDTINAERQQNQNLTDTINELTHDKLKLELVLEEASQDQSLSPDSKLAQAVENCKKSRSTSSRLNKTQNDLDWWKGDTCEAVKPLKTVRKPLDFSTNSNNLELAQGENLAEFIPIHQAQLKEIACQTRKECTPFLQGQGPLIASLGVNGLLLGVIFLIIFSGMKEVLLNLGVLKYEY